MGETAQVNSIDALKAIYEGVVLFREDAKTAKLAFGATNGPCSRNRA